MISMQKGSEVTDQNVYGLNIQHHQTAPVNP